jgi:hypothetical protein
VLGHNGELQQVILNLVRNAAEAMDGVCGRPRVLRVESAIYDSDNVLVAVEDSGAGIDQNDINRIFDLFYTTKLQGMGMGLSICRSIVEIPWRPDMGVIQQRSRIGFQPAIAGLQGPSRIVAARRQPRSTGITVATCPGGRPGLRLIQGEIDPKTDQPALRKPVWTEDAVADAIFCAIAASSWACLESVSNCWRR